MSAYNIRRCLVRMKYQSQEPIIFVPLISFTNEDSGNFILINPLDGSFNIYLLMATIISICPTMGKNVKNKIMQNLFIVFAD